MRRIVMAMLGGLMVSACSVVGVRTIEQPPYRVVETVGDAVEVRRYEPRVAAEAVVEAQGVEQGRNRAFQVLFEYISGANEGARGVAMKAPVETQAGGTTIEMTAPVEERTGTPSEVAMTAPVETEALGEGRYAMRFFLPADLTAETAPVPTDPRVRIVTVPETTVAALRFTGFIGRSSVEARKRELLDTLDESSYAPSAEPVALFYDPPWTIPFLRRNEVAVRVGERS